MAKFSLNMAVVVKLKQKMVKTTWGPLRKNNTKKVKKRFMYVFMLSLALEKISEGQRIFISGPTNKLLPNFDRI